MSDDYPNLMATEHDVPKEYIRNPDGHLLPPRVGHNWEDPAFRKRQNKPQQLEEEFRGRRYFTSTGNFDNPPPKNMRHTTHQLLHALSTRNRGTVKGGVGTAVSDKYVTLDDKVLRFYAFFSEPAPDGGVKSFWHRKVIIYFYPADDTIMIEEPRIPNSGLDGGAYLKRQKVKADPRQREQFPDEDYLTLNYFNVGQTVRINAVDFFLYDCDGFTRDLLTSLGVEVGPALGGPTESFMSSCARYEEHLRTFKQGVVVSARELAEAGEQERTARFLEDSGKIIRFQGLLDERGKVEGGIVRKLEVVYFVEDGSIGVVERPPASGEATPSLFLARGWLPKCGSLAKVNELTFAHRVEGQRAPFMGPDAYYRDTDLAVGATLNVLGRQVFLYDCDEYTRSFYLEEYGIEVADPIDVSSYFVGSAKPSSRGGRRSEAAVAAVAAATMSAAPAPTTPVAEGIAARLAQADTLRYYLHIAHPKRPEDRTRKFVLTYFPETNEGSLSETVARNSGTLGGCMMRRQPLLKPLPPALPRNAPGFRQDVADGTAVRERYTLYDIRVGHQLTLVGLTLTVTGMDPYTESMYTGAAAAPVPVSAVRDLLARLRNYLATRHDSAVKTFGVFDRDGDGRIGLTEFQSALRAFQITTDTDVSTALFDAILQPPSTPTAEGQGAAAPPPSREEGISKAAFMKWMGDAMMDDGDAVGALAEGTGISVEEAARLARQAAVLRQFRERLEGRCAQSVEMFRMMSTMPRAMAGRRADMHSFSNPFKDAMVTPVQVRRCAAEVLGGDPSKENLEIILRFFFPDMPAEQHFRPRDEKPDHALDLPQFQQKYIDMCRLSMLPEKEPPAMMKTSVI